MSSLRRRTNLPDNWTRSHSQSDANQRYLIYGPVRPMEEPGLLARLFGRR